MRDAAEASVAEAKAFADILTSPAAINMLSVFMNEQAVAKIAKKQAKLGANVAHSAVIGAGIMGGGIAYQAAASGIDVALRDINSAALEAGLKEAARNLELQVSKGRMSQDKAQECLARIDSSMVDQALAKADIVIEAVVEQDSVKQSVLAQTESEVSNTTIITSNTSTISIDRLASSLTRPQNFCGLHFFNPVPKMPLVEVIRGAQTSDQAVATAVGFAVALGKHPIIVNDGPGFFVNRVLFAYIIAAQMLIAEGVDYQQIDRVMQEWGWPMGPANLSDVIGLDTMVRCLDVMAADIPQRMAPEYISAIHTLHKNQRLGQKNGAGFYSYLVSGGGAPSKVVDDTALALVYLNRPAEISRKEIIERLSVALCLEAVRCIEEGIIESPAEADMALLWGLGFPRFRGGALRHIDTQGVREFCATAERYAHKGPLYELPQQLLDMRQEQNSFY